MKSSGWVKAALACALLASSGLANAAEAWTTARHVTYLYPNGGGFIFMLDGSAIGPANCQNRFKVPLSAPGYDAIVSSIITAFAGGFTVDANYDDTTLAGCDAIVNRVLVARS